VLQACGIRIGVSIVWEELLVSSLLVDAFGKVSGWIVKMEDRKLEKELIEPATNQCTKTKGGYIATIVILKFSYFSLLLF